MAAIEITQQMRQKAIDYKRNVASKYMLIEGEKIATRIGGEDFCVTRKIDGHMQCIFYDNGEVAMLNSNGTQKAVELKCLNIFASFMSKAGIKSAVLAAELYMPRKSGRPRFGDVASALATAEGREQLALAVYDIIEIDGEPFNAAHYKDVHARLTELFQVKVNNEAGLTVVKKSSLCAPVQMRTATSVGEIKAIYDEWVEGEGAEGLVVHSDNHIVSKIKPRHSIDAVVIGYTTSDRGVRDLMFAVRSEDGKYQMFAVGSNGLDDQSKVSLAQRLESKHTESQYILSDSRGIAYQMVVPEIVYEVQVLELIARGNDDKIKNNPLLTFDPTQGWLLEKITPGVSAFGVTLARERTDKSNNTTDVRISQLTDICPFEQTEGGNAVVEKSTLLVRRVFKKTAKDKVMLHKFLVWKTNKEATGCYPAYIFYHTDYSSSRKEMIKRDMACSSSEEQIMAILEAEIADNIKKGWEEIV